MGENSYCVEVVRGRLAGVRIIRLVDTMLALGGRVEAVCGRGGRGCGLLENVGDGDVSEKVEPAGEGGV